MRKMPCPDCPKHGDTPTRSVLLHPVLDGAELFLTSAWISEVRLEQQELVESLIKAIQALKHPYVIPLEAQLKNLLSVAKQVGLQIPCPNCQAATYWGMVMKVKVHWHMQRGEYWQAFKLEIESDVKKWLWMGRALWVRLLRPKLSHFARRILRRETAPQPSVQV